MFQHSHHVLIAQTSLQLSDNITLFVVCPPIYTGVISKETSKYQVLGRIIYIHTVQCGGQDGTLWHPCLYIPLRRHYTFDRDSELPLTKKELISLIRLIENFNSDNLYSKPRCHVVSEAFSILSHVLVTKTGFGLVIGFINNPQVVTTIESYTVTNLQTLKSLHTILFSLSAIVFTHSKYYT
jgi:hypothetical protein